MKGVYGHRKGNPRQRPPGHDCGDVRFHQTGTGMGATSSRRANFPRKMWLAARSRGSRQGRSEFASRNVRSFTETRHAVEVPVCRVRGEKGEECEGDRGMRQVERTSELSLGGAGQLGDDQWILGDQKSPVGRKKRCHRETGCHRRCVAGR